MRVAVLDDDPVYIDIVQRTIVAIGHSCTTFTHWRELLVCVERENYDLLIVDWQMPEMNGPDVVQWIRERQSSRMPIMMLTVRNDERDLVRALACGADDFVNKPVRVGELAARVKALLRRSHPGEEAQIHSRGKYQLNRRVRTVFVDGNPVVLKHREFELAWRLFVGEGSLLSRHDLIHSIWGPFFNVKSRCLDTHVWSIRSKLELRPSNGFKLTAVYGIGYRLEYVGEEGEGLDALSGMA
jgi:DNA-binding response OmpR family regulator